VIGGFTDQVSLEIHATDRGCADHLRPEYKAQRVVARPHGLSAAFDASAVVSSFSESSSSWRLCSEMVGGVLVLSIDVHARTPTGGDVPLGPKHLALVEAIRRAVRNKGPIAQPTASTPPPNTPPAGQPGGAVVGPPRVEARAPSPPPALPVASSTTRPVTAAAATALRADREGGRRGGSASLARGIAHVFGAADWTIGGYWLRPTAAPPLGSEGGLLGAELRSESRSRPGNPFVSVVRASGTLTYDDARGDVGHDAGLDLGLSVGALEAAVRIGHDALGSSGETGLGLTGAWYAGWHVRGGLTLGAHQVTASYARRSREQAPDQRLVELRIDRNFSARRAIGLGIRRATFDGASATAIVLHLAGRRRPR
jgi:hypothetical protein